MAASAWAVSGQLLHLKEDRRKEVGPRGPLCVVLGSDELKRRPQSLIFTVPPYSPNSTSDLFHCLLSPEHRTAATQKDSCVHLG